MASALETFRAQQEAANGIYERLLEVSALLGQLRTQVEVLARNEELKRLLEREESWLVQAQRTVVEVRHWREPEAQRFWRVWRDDGRSPWRWRGPRRRPPVRLMRWSRSHWPRSWHPYGRRRSLQMLCSAESWL